MKLETRRGALTFPMFLPVTTFGARHALDELVRPYLPRLASGVMVSRHYVDAERMHELRLPVWVDSGGFAALRGRVEAHRGLGLVVGPDGVAVHPREALEVQERFADVAFALDCPGGEGSERARRRELTLANAHWALGQRRRADLPLYAVVHGNADEAAGMARELAQGFAGVAVGGLVPHARDREHVREVVTAVRAATELPLHVFGLGRPGVVRELFEWGVQSVDSSAWARDAVAGRGWRPAVRIDDPTPAERLRLALLNLAAVTDATLPLSAWEWSR